LQFVQSDIKTRYLMYLCDVVGNKNTLLNMHVYCNYVNEVIVKIGSSFSWNT